jgi:anti-sigma regulatory factor (Ser/Thr protein kinase)
MARSWAWKRCAEFGVSEELVDTYKLLISETATNAVTHSGGEEYTVVVCPDGWIEVWDDSPKLPRQKPHDLDSLGGRGLELLELLAPGYLVVEDAKRGGKCVRFLPKEIA